MAHRKRYGRNEFLVHYKGFSELRGEYTEEAELRRNASELLDEYMKRHHIVTDGYRFDDIDYADSSNDENEDATNSSPPRKRKQPIATVEKSKSKRSQRGKKRKAKR